ncbi:hypothetical protein YSA_07588 [Pseudomonas putida ND6]|uniref:Uncharacterized protein n=1 Tax=Pseudomonas putida ND6 TaxID=231023 RepID=I3UZE4_PSEPU|nr:hypothetical protein YSA_07588 [Pseudomonas putida ND6]
MPGLSDDQLQAGEALKRFNRGWATAGGGVQVNLAPISELCNWHFWTSVVRGLRSRQYLNEFFWSIPKRDEGYSFRG